MIRHADRTIEGLWQFHGKTVSGLRQVNLMMYSGDAAHPLYGRSAISPLKSGKILSTEV